MTGAATARFADPATLAAYEQAAAQHQTPLIAVLDTCFVRTGLARQLRTGVLPRSLRSAHSGAIRLFMEKETLDETGEKLPLFAKQLAIPASQLVQMFADDWLPRIRVVALPPGIRALDQRALAVRDLDQDDYPTAALAALLSPCILLTHNMAHFRPLGTSDCPRKNS